jgi:flagellar assembly protein FliH
MRFEKYSFRTIGDRDHKELGGVVVGSFEEADEAHFKPLFRSRAQAAKEAEAAMAEREAKPPSFDESDVKQAHQSGYDEGFSAGQHAGLEEGLHKGLEQGRTETASAYEVKMKEAVEKAVTRHHHALEASVQALNLQLMQAFSESMEHSRSQQQDVLRLALGIAKKLAGAALARYPLDSIIPMLRDVLEAQSALPELRVRIAPELVEMMKPVCETLAKESGFKGTIMCVADASLGEGDAAVDWDQGHVVRDGNAILAEINAILKHADEGDAAGSITADETNPPQAGTNESSPDAQSPVQPDSSV